MPKAQHGSGRCLHLVVALVLWCVPGALAQPGGWTEGAAGDAERLRRVSIAAHSRGEGKLPPDFASLLDAAAQANPGDEDPALRRQRLEAELSSFDYLGRAGVSLDDVPEWGSIALMHLKLDRGHPVDPSARNPEGLTFPVAFLDGHVELMTRAEAELAIGFSRAVMEAAATGADYPSSIQRLADLRLISRAMHEYARLHDGGLPPDLGALLEHIPAGSPRTATPARRARVFLSPRTKASTHVPDDAGPEWVNRHASYVYLGAAGLTLERVEDPQRTVLVHSRLDDPETIERPDGRRSEAFALATAAGGVEAAQRPYMDWVIPASRKVLEFAASRGPLPDFQHAMRDLRVLGVAMKLYAQAHDGELPGALADLFDFIPADELRPPSESERARIFLTPRAERVSAVPEDGVREWVRAHCSYVYLGGPGLRLSMVRGTTADVLVHAPVDEPHQIMQGEQELRVIPYLMPGPPSPWAGPLPWIGERIEASSGELQRARKAWPTR
ncbi:MAG: hypothetical protein WD749_13470 [Phycisphaerales bacterium]